MRDEMIENMIAWAQSRLGETRYAGWCLDFIEDALEIGNGIEIFGGDCAKASAELYADAMRGGDPPRGAYVFYDCVCRSGEGPVNWGHCGIGLGEGRVIHAWDRVRIDDYRQIERMTALSGDHPRYIGWVPVERVLRQAPGAGSGGEAQESDGGMNDYEFLTLRQRPGLKEEAAAWFHEKWGTPEAAYLRCMEAYLDRETEYGWYLCLDGDSIVGGLGVIENDFHERRDLAPNVCAVYTEASHRGRGIAGRLLDMAVEDMRTGGVSPLYLLTDHEGFYERYGWTFLCWVRGDGEGQPSRMYVHR